MGVEKERFGEISVDGSTRNLGSKLRTLTTQRKNKNFYMTLIPVDSPRG